jgi:hypothetical protein
LAPVLGDIPKVLSTRVALVDDRHGGADDTLDRQRDGGVLLSQRNQMGVAPLE